MNQQEIEESVNLLGCEIGKGALSYLGLNVGINHKKVDSWTGLVDEVQKRLMRWEDKHLSFGGRIH